MGHVRYMAAVAGLPDERVFEVEAKRGLDERTRLALPFARKLTLRPESVEREDVEALRAAFSDAEIVQLVFAVCHFNTMNRLADAFGVPLEPTNVFREPWQAPEVAPQDAPAAPAAPAARDGAGSAAASGSGAP
jgi:hypothetical protein